MSLITINLIIDFFYLSQLVILGDLFHQGEVKKKKSSIFKQENISFCSFEQVVQLTGCAFCGFAPLNGLGVGWGRGENPWGQIFSKKQDRLILLQIF